MIEYTVRLEGIATTYLPKLEHDYLEYKHLCNIQLLHERSILKNLHTVLFREHCASLVSCNAQPFIEQSHIYSYELVLHKNKTFSIYTIIDLKENSLSIHIPQPPEIKADRLKTIIHHCFQDILCGLSIKDQYSVV
ncbi:hypothetical protein E2R51_09305 [Jeotgalibacillus sp. S-D1]|uniref:hypothetical protein n=1 Tax=Jeotgalibacillus sp. S-D1 TaxID=2552189 RepID=UPI001059AB45|nr:hypothetical protein [Jeotgalibacillus sp. S-D1]TDL32855.1 hypothetical protein E2R51_09305 [Jeotgalibacillus sp. S-D1]